MDIRPTQQEDISALQAVLEQTELFPSVMLPEMIAPYLNGNQSALWLTCHGGNGPVGFCYAAAEHMADGTWNMLAIAVSPDQQGTGCGASLNQTLEKTLRQQGQRVLIADTSGTDDFAYARKFYEKCGYAEEARIRNFWAEGDDKVTFWKAL